ncbi:MAG: tetratricopeptide repeat protein [Betaproteobacteria bacterium]|nr:tetratricopeptide repeat protein [Betaproteobacteria bacterium]
MNISKINHLLSLAENYFHNNNYYLSEQILKHILTISPSHSKANELLSYIYGNKGDLDSSYRLLELSCSAKECSPEALYYLGSAQLKMGLYEKAVHSLEKSIKKAGIFYEALNNLGTAYGCLGKIKQSLSCYQKCLRLNSNSYELFFNIGKCFSDLQCHYKALDYYSRALKLKPDFVEAWSNKGNTLHDTKRYVEALAHFDKVIQLKPDFAEAWFNKAITLHDLKRYEEALYHYDTALRIKPDLNWLFGDFVYTKMIICDWSDINNSINKFQRKIPSNEKITHPFASLAFIDDPLLHQQSAKIFAQDKYPLNPTLGNFNKLATNKKIRLAYFSADFKNHPVSRLTVELFELHDKNIFEIYAFSYGINDHSFLRLRLSLAFNHFINVNNMPDIEIAQLARNLQIDIAVDLGGYTANSRNGIFSYRAAPIQINYLGYPSTMGSDYFDYIIADKFVIPQRFHTCYSEKIIYLPNSYQANDTKRTISDKKFTKQELNLPEDSFIFCCFNNNYKIQPTIFDSWMRILNAVDDSVLFLYAENDRAKENLKKEAQIRSVHPSRLVFGTFLTSASYLSRYQVCDLFLDTHPYNGGTTSSDALWAGLPVLTLSGQSFVSRMGASLLNNIGIPELITTNQNDYESLAVDLALNPKKLAEIKQKLSQNRLVKPLFNSKLFTKNLESAFLRVYERYQANLSPDDIYIMEMVVPE